MKWKFQTKFLQRARQGKHSLTWMHRESLRWAGGWAWLGGSSRDQGSRNLEQCLTAAGWVIWLKTKAKAFPACLGEARREQSSVSRQESFQGKEQSSSDFSKKGEKSFFNKRTAAEVWGFYNYLVVLYREWNRYLPDWSHLNDFQKIFQSFLGSQKVSKLRYHLMRQTFNKKYK